MVKWLNPNYSLRTGSTLDRALLVKFMQRTYLELYPDQPMVHLAHTVEQYFSVETPLWWVYPTPAAADPAIVPQASPQNPAIACLWLGNAIDQIQGDRHAHIFLLYVAPDHRRQGIATALMGHAETWAKQRGDRQIGLQVFSKNQPALQLYQHLGYTTQSLWMVKPIDKSDKEAQE